MATGVVKWFNAHKKYGDSTPPRGGPFLEEPGGHRDKLGDEQVPACWFAQSDRPVLPPPVPHSRGIAELSGRWPCHVAPYASPCRSSSS